MVLVNKRVNIQRDTLHTKYILARTIIYSILFTLTTQTRCITLSPCTYIHTCKYICIM